MSRQDRESAQPLAGVELGGTKCICTLGSGPGHVLDQVTIPTTGPDETLAAIAAVLRGWMTDGRAFGALGIGGFGPLDLDHDSASYGRVLSTTKPGWTGAQVHARITEDFAVPALLDTDVNAAALAEARWGAGLGHRNLAYVTVGTGIGVGLLVDGRPPRGLGHCELGHMRIPPGDDGFESVCSFHRDCIEGLASGPAIEQRVAPIAAPNVPADHPAWGVVSEALAALCHAIVCGTAPTRIILGGGVVTGHPHLVGRIGSALVASLNGYVRVPMTDYVVAPALGVQAGPLGSLVLADMALERTEAVS